jgi:hypothetical protein
MLIEDDVCGITTVGDKTGHLSKNRFQYTDTKVIDLTRYYILGTFIIKPFYQLLILWNILEFLITWKTTNSVVPVTVDILRCSC